MNIKFIYYSIKFVYKKEKFIKLKICIQEKYDFYKEITFFMRNKFLWKYSALKIFMKNIWPK